MCKQILKFMLVAIVNTIDYYLVYLLLLYIFHLPYIVSHVIALILSIFGSFYLNSYFTYRSKPTVRKFFTFPFTYIVNIAASTFTLYVLVDILGWHEVISPLVASIVTFPITFLLTRRVLAD